MVPDQHPAAAALAGCLKLVQPLQAVRDRLFQQDMAACFGCGQGDIQMEGSRVGDDHRIRPGSQGSAQVRFNRKACQVSLRKRAVTGAVEQDISFVQPEQVAANGGARSSQARQSGFSSYPLRSFS